MAWLPARAIPEPGCSHHLAPKIGIRSEGAAVSPWTWHPRRRSASQRMCQFQHRVMVEALDLRGGRRSFRRFVEWDTFRFRNAGGRRAGRQGGVTPEGETEQCPVDAGIDQCGASAARTGSQRGLAGYGLGDRPTSHHNVELALGRVPAECVESRAFVAAFGVWCP